MHCTPASIQLKMAQNSSPSLNVDLPNINIHLARAPTNRAAAETVPERMTDGRGRANAVV